MESTNFNDYISKHEVCVGELHANVCRSGPAAAHEHRSLVPLLPVGVTGVSRVEFLGCSGACCYKRRQSKVCFVWLSVPLLRTSSIQGVFRVAFCPVVTNVVNPGAFSLKMVVFWLRLTTFVTGVGQVLWSGVIVLCPSGWVMR